MHLRIAAAAAAATTTTIITTTTATCTATCTTINTTTFSIWRERVCVSGAGCGDGGYAAEDEVRRCDRGRAANRQCWTATATAAKPSPTSIAISSATCSGRGRGSGEHARSNDGEHLLPTTVSPATMITITTVSSSFSSSDSRVSPHPSKRRRTARLHIFKGEPSSACTAITIYHPIIDTVSVAAVCIST